MASILNKLKDRQAILMMHLAGELPGEDSARVEQMLAADASLQSELESLRQLQQGVMDHLDAGEARTHAAPGEEAAVRRVLREMRRHQVELMARPQPAPAASVRRWPAWSYGLASAAASIIVLIGLWGMGVFDRNVTPGDGIGPVADSQPVRDETRKSELAFHESIFKVPGADPLDQATFDALELADADDDDPLLLLRF